jgi:hypothetical protein
MAGTVTAITSRARIIGIGVLLALVGLVLFVANFGAVQCAKPCNEFAPFHSITSSARSNMEVGTSRLRAFAVFRLTVSSIFVAPWDRQVRRLLALRMRAALPHRFPARTWRRFPSEIPLVNGHLRQNGCLLQQDLHPACGY